MTWSFTIPGLPPVTDTDLTTAELAVGFSLSAGMIPHRETDFDPSHCPCCRYAIAVVASMRTGLAMDVAMKEVGATPFAELREYVGD